MHASEQAGGHSGGTVGRRVLRAATSARWAAGRAGGFGRQAAPGPAPTPRCPRCWPCSAPFRTAALPPRRTVVPPAPPPGACARSLTRGVKPLPGGLRSLSHARMQSIRRPRRQIRIYPRLTLQWRPTLQWCPIWACWCSTEAAPAAGVCGQVLWSTRVDACGQVMWSIESS